MRVIVLHLPGCNVFPLGAYGNEWIRTPHLDRLATQSVVFDEHLATNPDPDAVEWTWHTGDYHLPGGRLKGPNRLAALAERDIPCYRFSDAALDIPEELLPAWEAAETVEPGTLIDRALDTLEELAEVDSWLLWLDATRLLPTWELFEEMFEEYSADWLPPESEEELTELEPWPDPTPGPFDVNDSVGWERLQRSFATAMTTLDLEIGGLIEECRERKLDEGVVWIVTSGFGWPRAEHGVIGPYRADLHEETLHVPLILRWPDQAHAGRRVTALTQTVDLLPTLLDLFGCPVPCGGRSFKELALGKQEPIREYAFFGSQVEAAMEWGLRTPEWALHLTLDGVPRAPRMYEKPTDRYELNDVRQQQLDWSEALESQLREIVALSRQDNVTDWPPLPIDEN